MKRVFIDSIDNNHLDTIRKAFAWLDVRQALQGKTVFVKANLTYPNFRPGVMTTPESLEAILAALSDIDCRVYFGEADSGGYNPFSMDEVFAKMNLHSLAERYGAELVNLSSLPQMQHTFRVGNRTCEFQYASLFDDVDMTISVPVPKIHMNTGVSLVFKNLWGCISFPAERLRLHPVLPHAVYEISQTCKLGMAIMDGTYGLNRSGPMAGDVVPLNWLLASFDSGAACNVTARLMGLDPFKDSTHLDYLRTAGLIPDITDIECNQDWTGFAVAEPFFLKRKWTDYPGLLAFHSHFWAHIAYFSRLSRFLHWVLYLFRDRFY